MNIQVRLFAVARQLAGAEMLMLDLPAGSTLGQLRSALQAAAPGLTPILPQIMLAIGSEYAPDDTPIPQGSEVACIPPVSGG